MQLPSNVINIINRFENAGFCAYITGGAVRDLLMGISPKEYHISTDAKPYIIKSLFPHTVDVPDRYGALTIIDGGKSCEVSTFRNDGVYIKYKRTDKNVFTNDLFEDLSHRDFTINAMAFNPKEGLIDPYCGADDIKNKRIGFVGNLSERIAESPERILRAVRFAAVFDFKINSDTLLNLRKCGVMIKKLSCDFIYGELDKILMSQNPANVRLLHDVGLLKYIMPELDICFSVEQKNKYHIYNVGDHIIAALANTPDDYVLRWSALFHDIGKPRCQSTDQSGIIHFYGHHRESVRIANDIMRRMHFDNENIRDICMLIENHDVRIEATPISVKHMLSRCGKDNFEKLLILQSADNKGKNPKYLPEKLKKLQSVHEIYKTIIAENQPYKVSDLVITSRDLIKLGFRAGREIGDTLRILLDEVVLDPSLNNYAYLISRVKQIKSKRRKLN